VKVKSNAKDETTKRKVQMSKQREITWRSKTGTRIRPKTEIDQIYSNQIDNQNATKENKLQEPHEKTPAKASYQEPGSLAVTSAWQSVMWSVSDDTTSLGINQMPLMTE
jgi:hypothetical protein